MAESSGSENLAGAENSLRETLASLAVFVAGMAALQLLMAIKGYGDVVSNLKYLMGFAKMAADGLLPYRDFPIEYTPLGAAWLCAFAPFSGDMAAYRPAFTTGMSLWALAGLPAVWRIAARLAPAGNSRFKATLLYTVLLVAAGPIGIVSFDWMPAALTAWALALKLDSRGLAAAGVLAACAAAKMFPVVLLPLFLLHTIRNEGFSKAARELLVFAAVASVFFGVPFLLAPEGFAASFAYHLGRGVEAGSIYAVVIHITRIFGGGEVPVFSHGSWGFQGGAMSNPLGAASTFVLLGLLASVYIVYAARLLKEQTEKVGNCELATACAAVLLAFILGFKVGSPQFFGWLAPFAAGVAITRSGRYSYCTFVCACVLSQMVFPWFWEDLIFANPGAITVLTLEKMLLVSGFAGLFAVKAEKA